MHVALQLCDASGEAHAQGVVHRDLKPENVMLVRRGEDPDYVKVLDFGIARLNWGEQSMATAAGLIFGTARYISPEGAQGEQVGPAGDVYSIATLLFQMLAGRTPFEGDQAVALLVQQIHDPPPQVRSLSRASYVPEPICEVIMKNLAKDPGAREPDARALGRSLIDAAKASGMSPDELVVRSGLMGSRQSGAMQLPPMQRTKQLQLSAELSEQLAQKPAATAPPASASGPSNVGPTAYEAPGTTPHGEPYFPPPGRGSPSAPTTKWTPPPGFAALLAPPPPRASSSSDGRGPDQTLDDESAPIVPAPPPSAPSEPARTAPPSAPPSPATTQPLTPVPTRALQPSPPSYPLTPTAPGASMTKPGAVDRTLDDDDVNPMTRRKRSRAAVLVLFCFLLGAGIAVGVAYRAGLVGPRVAAASADAQIARASEALKSKRWDTPPGDNVKDLTSDGLARWPGDARLLDLRARATDELVKEALDHKFSGDLTEALRLARLARELDPSDTTAQHLVDELELAVGQVAPQSRRCPSRSSRCRPRRACAPRGRRRACPAACGSSSTPRPRSRAWASRSSSSPRWSAPEAGPRRSRTIRTS